MPFCKNCGKELTNEKFCPNCGITTIGGELFETQKNQMNPKKRKGLLVGLIATATFLILLVIIVIIFNAGNNRSRLQSDLLEVNSNSPTTIPSPTPTAIIEATPTQIPQPDTVTINLDYGEEYECSVKDFDVPDSIKEDDVKWPTIYNDPGVTCNNRGELQATNIQFDPNSNFNSPVYISGQTSYGIELQYEVIVGNGKTYSLSWSDTARNMKTVRGYTYVSTPEIRHCLGFTLMFGYDLNSGKIAGKNWSVWIRENGDTWVLVGNIPVTEGDYEYHDLLFDRPITFNEIIVQAPKEYNQFSASLSYDVTNIIFDVG
jgi:hypothetical protein